MKTGLVKWFNKDKGYGFIKPSDGSSDVFVHYSDIVGEQQFKTLLDGQNVQYEEAEGNRGIKAKNVTVVAGDPHAC